MIKRTADMQRRYFSYGIKNAIINGPQIVHLEAGSTKNKVVTLDRICIPYVSCFLFLKKWTSLWKYILFLHNIENKQDQTAHIFQ